MNRRSEEKMYYPSTMSKLLMALLLATISPTTGRSYPSGYNTGQYRYFPSAATQYPTSGSNTGQYLPSDSSTREYPQSQLNAGQYFLSPHNTGRYPPVGHNFGQSSHGQYMYHNNQNHDVTEVCKDVVCGEGSCAVVIRDEHSPPRAICSTADGIPSIPRDAYGACRPFGLTTAVLTGDPEGLLPLEAMSCFTYEDCPYGSRCVNNACCFGRPNCTETLGELFQASFEFNGRTYAVSSNFVGNDEHAQAICLARGGYLAEIETAEEDAAIRNFVSTLPGTFSGVMISGTDREVEGEFVFQYSGRDVVYQNFAPGFPDNTDPGQDCLELRTADDFQWNDIMCVGRADTLFLCEFPEVLEIKKKTSYSYYHY